MASSLTFSSNVYKLDTRAESNVKEETNNPQKTLELHRYVPTQDPFLSQLEGENTAWERFKAFFHETSQLSKDIIELSAQITELSNTTEFDQAWSSLSLKVIEAFRSSGYYRLRPHLRLIIKTLDHEKLASLFRDVIKNCAEDNNLKGLHNFLGISTLDELMEGDKLETLMETIEFMAKCEAEDRNLADALRPTASGFSYFIKTVHGILDTILMAVNFFEIGKEPATAWDASYLLATYATVLSAPLAIFGALSTFLPVLTAVIVTAAIVLAIILLVWIYVKFLKPCPEHIEPCVNLTSKARQGVLTNVVGRNNEIEKILKCLDSSNSKFRVHPILVGPSTAGKDTLLNGLAIRIIQGNVPDSLKGIDLQKVNARNLKDTNIYDPQNKVQRLVSRIGPHKDKVVPIFNEIHEAKQIWANLLSVLDGDSEALHRAIFVTTPEGYAQMVKENLPLANRLERIDINPTDKENTIWILRELARQEGSDLEITEELLENIYEAAVNIPGACQPKTSVGLLSKAISEIRRKQSGYGNTDAIQEMQIKYDQLLSRFRSNPNKTIAAKLRSIELEIQAAKKLQTAQKIPVEKLANLRKFKNQQKESVFKIAFDIMNNKNLSPYEIESMKKFVQFAQKNFIAILDQIILQQVKENGATGIEDFMHIDIGMIRRLALDKEKSTESMMRHSCPNPSKVVSMEGSEKLFAAK